VKTYIKKIVLFLIPLIAITVLMINCASGKHQFHSSSWYYHDDFQYAFQKGDAELLALGNSKLLSAIDKEVLEDHKQRKVALLGYSSTNISVSKLTLESYINSCSIMPEQVILEVSWFTFNTKRTHLHNIVGDLFVKDPKLWKHYFKYSNDLSMDIKRAFKRSLNLNSSTQLNKKELSYAVKFKAKSPLTKDYTFNVDDLEVLFPDHIAGIDVQLLKDYKAIVDICVKNQIDLILFTAPEDETYSKHQKDIDAIKSIFQKSSKNNPNVYYFDYSFGGQLWKKKYEMWLKDSHHINENDLFTEVLIDDIKLRTNN